MDIVVQTYGTAISRDNETFIISNKDGKRRIPPDGIASFQNSKGVQITSDAIFLANLTIDVYEQIRKDLAEVNDCYENMDSILIVPISPEYISSMKVIGLSIDVDLISKNKNTLFF